jgi:riboflavin biosynthesis pyrimidine reductase
VNPPEILAPRLAPAGEPLELLFERSNAGALLLPRELLAIYQGALGLPEACVFANFVASLDGLVALPGDTESGQIISGKSAADRFVMGLLRSCADAVLLGAGTFRKSSGHLWQPSRIYPPAAALFAEARQGLGLRPQPLLVLLSGSGELDPNEPAIGDAWLFTTKKGEAKLQGKLPSSTRLTVLAGERIQPTEVLAALRAEGLARVLTEGGPSLFAELVKQGLVDELFLTSSPVLFGRFPNDDRKSLTNGLDLGGARLELASLRRHGSHLFLRYAFNRDKS